MKIIDLPAAVAGKPKKVPHPKIWRAKITRTPHRIYVKAGNKTTTKVYRHKATFDKITAERVVAKIAAKGSILVKNWIVVKVL